MPVFKCNNLLSHSIAMDYKKLVHISGKAGLFEVLKQRQDGLIVKSIVDQKSTFVSTRINQFSLLENISIYTEDDSVPLFDVFEKMVDQKDQWPVPSPKDSSDDLKAYFEKILPEYDKDQVFISDIKKVVKWFTLLEPVELNTIIEKRRNDLNKSKNNSEEE